MRIIGLDFGSKTVELPLAMNCLLLHRELRLCAENQKISCVRHWHVLKN